jgi:thiol:disulfide interchange protein/DsbC/DsbD-like thiol-disulfide interchange protein
MAVLAAFALLQVRPALAARVGAVEVDLVADRDAAVPGGPLTLGLRIRHDPHWHTYWRHAGDSGLPTQLELTLPPGWTAGPLQWPQPIRLNVGPLANYGYEGDLLLPVRVTVPATAPRADARVEAFAQWLVCREVCVPGEARLTLTLPVRERADASPHASAFSRANASLPRGTLRLTAAFSAERVALQVMRPTLGSAEFFPYREGLIRAAAPQRLYRLEGGGWRLDLEPAEASAGASAWASAPVGLLVLDGESFEVAALSQGPVAGGGTLVASATGVDVVQPASAGTSLLSGVGLAGSSGSGAAEGGALGLVLALAGGLIGGLLLNLMPCVFPVIGLKVLGFAGHAANAVTARRRGALAFSVGVLLSFWLLAAVLIGLRAAGQAVGWGFQLQSPGFVTVMILLFVAMGLNFAGVFEIGLSLTRAGGLESGRAGSTAGAFGSGVLAVLVATPCTAPFMGSALGYTLGRSAVELFTVFSAIGLGMALPYLLIGWWPRALGWLPKPGRWMESFRQFLAFPMFATAAWLLWVLAQQAGVDAVLAVAIGAVLLALAAWLYGRFVQSVHPKRRALAAVFAFACLAGSVWTAWPSGEAPSPVVPASGANAPGRWEPWSEARVAQAIAEGRTVFVDFTAAWCVTCQVNKRLVLQRDPVAAEFSRRAVVLLRADWTNRDPEITRALASHGRNGVPLYLVHRPGASAPTLLPELLTPGLVLDALRN